MQAQKTYQQNSAQKRQKDYAHNLSLQTLKILGPAYTQDRKSPEGIVREGSERSLI